jgi:PKD repeat protein
MKKLILLLIVLFFSYGKGNAQQLVSYEYWFDNNYGSVVITAISNQYQFDISQNVSATGLSTGVHFFHIRFKGSDGKYSIVLSRPFFKEQQNTGLTAIYAYEYWFDNDYANHISNSFSNVSQFDLNTLINSGSMSTGVHTFHIRFHQDNGNWTSVLSKRFYSFPHNGTLTDVITAYRYYYNNIGGLIKVNLPAPSNQAAIISRLATRNYTHPDTNILHIQFKDTLQYWSCIITDTFTRPYIPVAYFKTNVNEICKNQSVIFTDSTTEADSYLWNFGDGNTSTTFSPTHQYTTSGTFTVSLTGHSSISGLDSTITHSIIVHPLPTATISGTTAVCRNAIAPNITFTGASGTNPYTFTYKINGGSDLTVSTTSGNSVTVAAPTGTAGTFDYSLVSVSDNHACSQAQSGSATITVYPLPTASISGTTAVCRNAASPNITFTGASGTTPYTFTYKINGGSDLTVSTTSGNSVTVAVPTGTAGTFIYSLVSVSDNHACSQTQSGSATITVYPLPTASIGGTTAVCQNATSPNITFTGASGTSPYTFTYKINGGSDLTVSTTSGNSVTVAAPTGTTGTFIYSLVSISDNHACSQTQSGSATITVYPLPTASIGGTTAVCQNATSPNITFTGASGTSPYTFTYKINGGSDLTVSTTSGNSVTVAMPTGTAGTFIYSLVSVSDNHACSQTQSGNATITIYPLPTATISGTATICFGTSTNLSVVLTGTQPWSITYTDGTTPITITGITTSPKVISVSPSSTKTYTVTAVSDANCTGTSMTGSAVITVDPYPSSAGTISGPNTFLLGSTGIVFSVGAIANATSYIWSYSGTGVTINGTGNSVTIDFSTAATNGQITVKGHNYCGDGAVSVALNLNGYRVLNLSSVLLEGLHNGTGAMYQARDEYGPHWPAGVADHITIELHNASTYNTIVYTIANVSLSTGGAASVNVPSIYDGSYYITIKHRNSVETTTATAVLFTGSIVSRSFGIKTNVYGGNLGGPVGGYYFIYAGDVNQDGIIDTQDYIGIDNDSYNYNSGYLDTDVDGNGSVDTNDYIAVDNNNYNYIGTAHP